jgi:hypothetical protein
VLQSIGVHEWCLPERAHVRSRGHELLERQ